jgi:hypothetical protein
MDFTQIKAEKKERHCTVEEMIVLSNNNDPFYIGATPAHNTHGQWFEKIWTEHFNDMSNVHLRRIHYRLVSQENPVLKPDGKPYENTERCREYLALASKYARWLDLVDPGSFDDRRNGKPELFYVKEEYEEPLILVSNNLMSNDFSVPEMPSLPEYESYGFNAEQRYHLEIWCEKSTMNDVLHPLCLKYEVNLVTGLGEISITQCKWLADRVNEHRKPCRIFYVSDFDPAGLSMPVAASRKIEKFLDGTRDL